MKDTLKDDVDTAIEKIVGLRSNIQVIDETLSEVVSDLHSISYRISTQNEEKEKEDNKTYIVSITRAIRNEDFTFHITDQYLNIELNETEMKKFEELLKEFKS